MDGAGDLRVLWSVALPLSKPALATVGLYYAVNRWNGYFWSMLVLESEDKIPLQVLLRRLVVEMTLMENAAGVGDRTATVGESLIYATIVISVVPILLVYPYLQRYFVKGIMLGAVKG